MAVIFKAVFWACGLFTVVYIGFGLMLFAMQSKFLYYPIKKIDYTPSEIGLTYEDVYLDTSDGIKLNAWYIPAKDSNFTILFCHGNGGNIMHRLDSIRLFNSLGLNCFIFDYRGYGKSQGKPTEAGTYLDSYAAYDWLINEMQIDPEKIIIFGRSIGGCIAAKLAAEVDAALLVLESTFTSYVDMGKKFYWYMPVKLFARYKYRTIDYVKNVNIPVLVIHSPDDELVPFEFGRLLYQAANEPREFIEISGGHNDGFLTSGRTYTNAWKNRLQFLIERQK